MTVGRQRIFFLFQPLSSDPQEPDGTSICLTTAAVFIAQATSTPMSLMQEIALPGVLLLT
jgi:Na+/H+-dicarboxylate symporter